LARQKIQLMNETVYQSLRGIIAGRRFKPGERINVEKLARELGVSRTPVWEAIRRLGQEGIIQNIPNRGVLMAERPPEKVKDILEVRLALDGLAGRLAVKRINDSIINKLSKHLSDLLKAIDTADIATYFSTDISFHRLITEATGNDYLKALYESITMHVFPNPNILTLMPSLYTVHQEIVAALNSRDTERVERAVARHGELLINYINAQIASEAERKEIVRRIKENSPVPAVKSKSRKQKQ
jgi:DNA-binding GntR family transcriptional regulator